jgi:hypothetical protein
MRALLLALLVTTACASDQKEVARDPAPAPPRTAQQKVDDKATEDLEARNSVKADVATAKADADADAAKAHSEIGAQLQKDFDEADRRFKALEVKAASATGTTKKRATSTTSDVKTHESAVMAGIAKLRDANGAAWDTTKAKVDSDMVALNQAIDSLEKTLK